MAVIVGLSLGLTGGGGSIFAVPLLVYGLGLDFRSSVALSLAVVGLTSAYGAALQARQGHVLWGAGAVLGLGGVLAAPLGAWIGAQMPQRLSLLLFAALMVFIGATDASTDRCGNRCAPFVDKLPEAAQRLPPFQSCLRRKTRGCRRDLRDLVRNLWRRRRLSHCPRSASGGMR